MSLKPIDLIKAYPFNTKIVGQETQFYDGCIHDLHFGVHKRGKKTTPFIVVQTEVNSPDHRNSNTALQSIRYVKKALGKNDDISLITSDITKNSEADKFGATTLFIVGNLPKAIVKLSAVFGEVRGGILISRIQDAAEDMGLPASSVRNLKFEPAS